MKLVSVNIERDQHHDTVITFLKKEKPETVCLQEVFEDEVYLYEEALSMVSVFKPMGYWNCSKKDCKNKEGVGKIGIAILSKNIDTYDCKYIIGEENNIPVFQHASSPLERNILNILVMWANILDNNGVIYTVANTHFTWTSEGVSTLCQREDAVELVKILNEDVKDFVFVGDTNAPRGIETFDFIANHFSDNIPEEYKTSIDQNLHRVKGLQYMVDCLFTTPNYKASNVKLVDGVSDHMAVVAEINKK